MVQGRAIRPSQFVLTYGVGSLIESSEGSRVIPEFHRWSNELAKDAEMFLKPYDIGDQDTRALLGGNIFAIPTNADLHRPDDQAVFATAAFPNYGLCQRHDPKVLGPVGTYRNLPCPRCHTKIEQKNAIRFVRACPAGHLDDVDWSGIIHTRAKSACKGLFFEWIISGSELRNITLRCVDCKFECTMADVYDSTAACWGLWPENGRRDECHEKASVLLRNAGNLRVPVVYSVLTIPPKSSALHRILQQRGVYPILVSEKTWKKATLLEKLSNAAQAGAVDKNAILTIQSAPDDELLKAIAHVKEPPPRELDVPSMKLREARELKRSAVEGAPPSPSKIPQDFEVNVNEVKKFPLPGGTQLRVTPIRRLRVVMIQTGYYRPVRGMDGITSVRRFLEVGNEKWYPGVELRGEGIFLDLPASNPKVQGEYSKQWEEAQKTATKNVHQMYHPNFVWWHTLSHRIIASLGIDSGYSSASLRERIYFQDDGSSRLEGLLIFAAQRGGDGTMGGLIALVPEFDRVIESALTNIHTCSNDPLCSETTIGPSRKNGASCFACTFVSETSCEQSNSFLDRNLLRFNI